MDKDSKVGIITHLWALRFAEEVILVVGHFQDNDATYWVQYCIH